MCEAFPKVCKICGRLKIYIDDLIREDPDAWITKQLIKGKCSCPSK